VAWVNTGCMAGCAGDCHSRAYCAPLARALRTRLCYPPVAAYPARPARALRVPYRAALSPASPPAYIVSSFCSTCCAASTRNMGCGGNKVAATLPGRGLAEPGRHAWLSLCAASARPLCTDDGRRTGRVSAIRKTRATCCATFSRSRAYAASGASRPCLASTCLQRDGHAGPLMRTALHCFRGCSAQHLLAVPAFAIRLRTRVAFW